MKHQIKHEADSDGSFLLILAAFKIYMVLNNYQVFKVKWRRRLETLKVKIDTTLNGVSVWFE